jgi:hypothetical protein
MDGRDGERRVGNVDLLSRVQLEEVLRLLDVYSAKHAIDFVTQDGTDELKDSKSIFSSPERIAVLMSRLLDDECDVLVLDATCLPTRMPVGLTIGALTRRITPYDALISSDDCILDELREGAGLVTSTLRREAQLRYYRPDLKIARTQGSLDAVLQKVKSGKADCAVVAAADVERLNKQECVRAAHHSGASAAGRAPSRSSSAPPRSSSATVQSIATRPPTLLPNGRSRTTDINAARAVAAHRGRRRRGMRHSRRQRADRAW